MATASVKKTVNVIGVYYDSLNTTLFAEIEGSFLEFLGKLYPAGIIDRVQKISIGRSERAKGVNQLLHTIETYVEQVPEKRESRTRKVIGIMKEMEWLVDIAKQMDKAFIPDLKPMEDTDGGNIIVFLSYTRKKGASLVDPLYDCLEGIRGLQPWKDTEDLTAGQELTPEIRKGIESCSLFVCSISSDYFKRPFCRLEFDHAIRNKKQLLPIEWIDGSTKFEFPAKYTHLKLGDILRHKYDPHSTNEEAEVATCAAKIIKLLNNN